MEVEKAMTEDQAKNDVWTRMIHAEVRSGYFGDLAARYTRHRQVISGLSLLLGSAAFGSFWADSPQVAPWFGLIIAVSHAYAVAVGLDKRATTAARLYVEWSRLGAEYNWLWHHWWEPEAERAYDELIARARSLSETATTETPTDDRLLSEWIDRVYALYAPASASPA